MVSTPWVSTVLAQQKAHWRLVSSASKTKLSARLILPKVNQKNVLQFEWTGPLNAEYLNSTFFYLLYFMQQTNIDYIHTTFFQYI